MIYIYILYNYNLIKIDSDVKILEGYFELGGGTADAFEWKLLPFN